MNFFLKSYIFCLYFNLYLHVWIRIRIRNTDADPDPGSSCIRIQSGSGSTTLVSSITHLLSKAFVVSSYFPQASTILWHHSPHDRSIRCVFHYFSGIHCCITYLMINAFIVYSNISQASTVASLTS